MEGRPHRTRGSAHPAGSEARDAAARHRPSSSTSATGSTPHYFTHALGFRKTAYAGLETGMRDRTSHLVEQGRIRFLLTSRTAATRSPATSPSTATG